MTLAAVFGVDWRTEIRGKKVTVARRSQQVRDNEGMKQTRTEDELLKIL